MNKHILYVIVRNDLASMNPGKAAAQACHAANQFVNHYSNDPETKMWQNQAAGFGTTIVLAADITTIRNLVEDAKICGIPAGIVLDPTYPVKDGNFTHFIPIDTAAYVFGTKEELFKQTDISQIDLMP
jgi:peptidyl-tRNA hydrolase